MSRSKARRLRGRVGRIGSHEVVAKQIWMLSVKIRIYSCRSLLFEQSIYVKSAIEKTADVQTAIILVNDTYYRGHH